MIAPGDDAAIAAARKIMDALLAECRPGVPNPTIIVENRADEVIYRVPSIEIYAEKLRLLRCSNSNSKYVRMLVALDGAAGRPSLGAFDVLRQGGVAPLPSQFAEGR